MMTLSLMKSFISCLKSVFWYVTVQVECIFKVSQNVSDVKSESDYVASLNKYH